MSIDRKRVIDPDFPAVILDIKGLVTRSYHSGTDGHPVRDEVTGARVNSAGHGMVNFLERVLLPILESVAPINIIAVADGGNDLRRAVFPTYKIKRAEKKNEAPAAQEEQLKLLLEMVNRLIVYLGGTVVKVPHREADDVIGALCKGLGHRFKRVYTVDQDLLQLADDDTAVILFDTPADIFKFTFERKGEKDIIEVEPGLVALFKSLIGDSSDEYPGVKGIGPVKWLELEEILGTGGLYDLDRMVRENDFQDLFDAAKANPQVKILTTLSQSTGEWRQMYYLARLHPESCWGAVGKRIIKPEWTKRVPDRAKAFACLVQTKCEDMFEQLEKWFTTMTLADEDGIEAAFNLLNQELEDSPVAGFDYEGFDQLKNEAFQEAVKKGRGGYVDVMSQVPTGASFCFGQNLQHSIYIPVQHRDTKNVDRANISAVLEELHNNDKLLVVQNVSFELTVTANNYAEGEAPIIRPHDTRILGSYHDENMMGLGKDGLKDMSWELLRYRQTEYQELLDQFGAEDMRGLSGAETLAYGCDDSITACHLWVLFRWSTILEGQWDWFRESHTAPAHVMEGSFRKGINIDWEALARLEAADRIVIDKGNARIRELLTEHCKESNMAHVEAFMEADKDAIHYQLSEKWKKKNDGAKAGHERMDALVSEVKMAHFAASRYVPYVEKKRTFEFLGTPTQLRDITGQLGFEPALEKATNKAIQEWLVLWADVKLTDQQREFVARLGCAAGKPLKDRAGPEFDDLKEIAVEVMQPLMKSDWEGDELNYDSSVQMQRLLYCKLGLPVRRRSKVDKLSYRYERGFDGAPSTDKNAINAALAEDCDGDDWRRELLTTLRDVKAAMTRFELFYVPYPLWKHPVDNCIHAGVKDPGTVTRRPTSGKPNVLQVSKGPTREAFIPHHDEERIGSVSNLLAGMAAVIQERANG